MTEFCQTLKCFKKDDRSFGVRVDSDNYAYLFWRGEYNSFRADGKYSQISMVLPEKNAVVSLVAECRKGDELMRALYDLVCSKL